MAIKGRIVTFAGLMLGCSVVLGALGVVYFEWLALKKANVRLHGLEQAINVLEAAKQRVPRIVVPSAAHDQATLLLAFLTWGWPQLASQGFRLTQIKPALPKLQEGRWVMPMELSLTNRFAELPALLQLKRCDRYCLSLDALTLKRREDHTYEWHLVFSLDATQGFQPGTQEEKKTARMTLTTVPLKQLRWAGYINYRGQRYAVLELPNHQSELVKVNDVIGSEAARVTMIEAQGLKAYGAGWRTPFILRKGG